MTNVLTAAHRLLAVCVFLVEQRSSVEEDAPLGNRTVKPESFCIRVRRLLSRGSRRFQQFYSPVNKKQHIDSHNSNIIYRNVSSCFLN